MSTSGKLGTGGSRYSPCWGVKLGFHYSISTSIKHDGNEDTHNTSISMQVCTEWIAALVLVPYLLDTVKQDGGWCLWLRLKQYVLTCHKHKHKNKKFCFAVCAYAHVCVVHDLAILWLCCEPLCLCCSENQNLHAFFQTFLFSLLVHSLLQLVSTLSILSTFKKAIQLT